MKIKKEKTICRREGCYNPCSIHHSIYEYPKEFCSKKCYKDELNKYSEDKLVKQVFKQKAYEVGIIPLGILSLIFIPKWVGRLLYYIFPKIKEIMGISELSIGWLFILILGCIITLNIMLALYIIEKKFLRENKMEILENDMF